MDLQSIEKEALEALERAGSLPEIDALHAQVLGRKDGQLTAILRNLATLPPDQKKIVGQQANQLRATLESRFSAKQSQLQLLSINSSLEKEKVDLTLPGRDVPRGHSHPIQKNIREITSIFQRLGFDVAEGPELESDTYNFTDLNIPENHPARDMQDTFYVDARARGEKGEDLGPLLLRTHTSPVQIRVMKTTKPPIRLICPGRVFRHEATDATHAAIFHQVEGLVVDEGVSFADLKAVLATFAEKFFGSNTRVRFMPSYFPFVEPGAQMDVQCFLCQGTKKLPSGDSCSLCKATGWIEMLGAGMVHPQVLRNVGCDPEKYTGFAFGMGVERIVMTRAQVRDIRYFLESDLRFLEQF